MTAQARDAGVTPPPLDTPYFLLPVALRLR